MFDGFDDFRMPAERPDPPPARPALTRRQERAMLGAIGLNLLLALVAPIGGATLFAALRALLLS